MADITFTIKKRESNGKRATGTLSWPARSLSSAAISGHYGEGALPLGLYSAPRSKLLDKPANSAYCDPSSNCWMQAIDPTFETDRTELGVHPDGGVVGTEGCIGLRDTNTKAWYDAFYAVTGSTSVEVVENLQILSESSDLASRVERRPIVTVIGGATNLDENDASLVGRVLAELGVDLLTGAGPGVMTNVARAFCRTAGRRGVSIGVVPGRLTDGVYKARGGYPNDWVEIPIYTHLPGDHGPTGADTRNHLNVLSADLVVALPGAAGTEAEVNLAIQYRRPVIFFNRSAPPTGVPIASNEGELRDLLSTLLTH